ncbi:MAG: HpcH/HpaI aldolase family protein [Burkholderiales bacterium]
MKNHARRKLAEGKLVLCMGVRQIRSPDVALLAAECGFDAMFVDMEHSAFTTESASAACIGALVTGLTPLVRPPSQAGDGISRALDTGAQGVIVPHVDDAAQARAVVHYARFSPLGKRSVMGPTAALGYHAMPQAEVMQTLNAETLVIVMLETPQAIANADEIAAVAGIDVLLIGSNDLCAEMGIPGQFRHARLKQAYEVTAKACANHGKTLGVGGVRGDPELQADLYKLGARFIIAGNDTGYLLAAARKDVESLRTLAT